jgi:hypothetical protein
MYVAPTLTDCSYSNRHVTCYSSLLCTRSNSCIFWNIMLCSLLKGNRQVRRGFLHVYRISEFAFKEMVASTATRLQKHGIGCNRKATRFCLALFQFSSSRLLCWYLLHVGFLLGLFFDAEDGGDTLLRDFRRLSTDYTYIPRHRTLHNHTYETSKSYRMFCHIYQFSLHCRCILFKRVNLLRRTNHEAKRAGTVYTKVTQLAIRFHSDLQQKFGSNEQKDARSCLSGHNYKECVFMRI